MKPAVHKQGEYLLVCLKQRNIAETLKYGKKNISWIATRPFCQDIFHWSLFPFCLTRHFRRFDTIATFLLKKKTENYASIVINILKNKPDFKIKTMFAARMMQNAFKEVDYSCHWSYPKL